MDFDDWKILHWAARHRVASVFAMLALFAWGLFGCWSFIVDQSPRFDPWQRWLLWAGDVTAVLSAVVWMFAGTHVGNGDEVDPFSVSYAGVARRLTAAMALVILFDLGITIHGIWSEYDSYHYATGTTATVTGTSQRTFRLLEPRTFYRVDFGFQDVIQKPRRSHVVFSQYGNHPLDDWQKDLMPAVEKKVPTVEIMYDARRPTRTWAKGQRWDDQRGVSALCLCVHAMQVYLLGSFAWTVFMERPDAIYRPEVAAVVPLLPLAIEAIILFCIGTVTMLAGPLI